MLEYVFDGQTFNVHPSQKDNFLQKYPEAQLVGEGNLSPEEFKANVNEQAGLVKTEDPVKETAVAGSQNESSMELPSEDGSLELPKFDPANPLGLPTDVDPNSPANIKKAAELKKIEEEKKKIEEEKKKKLDNVKKYETSLVENAFDDIVNNPTRMQEILGTYDIRSIAGKNYDQIPGELTKEIVNSLGVSELVEGREENLSKYGLSGTRYVEGNENKPGEGFSVLTRSEVYRTIKDRFGSLAAQKTTESKQEDHNTGYRGVNLNAENVSHQEFHDSEFEIFNSTQSGIQKEYTALKKQLLDKSLTPRELNEVNQKIKKLEEFAANNMQTSVIGISRAGAITKQVNLLDPDDFFIDTDTGMNVQANLVDSRRKNGANIEDVTEKVEDKMALFGTDQDRLLAGWKDLNYAQHGWKLDGEQTYKVKINNPTLDTFLRQDGYEPVFNEATKTFEWEVPLSVLAKRGHRIINSTGMAAGIAREDMFGQYKYKDIELISSPHADEKDLPPREFGNLIYNYHQQGLDYAVDRQAYNKLLWMNKSPESLERTPFYTSINRGINMGVGMDPRQAKISMSDVLPAMDMITAQAGVQLSDKQRKAFETTFSEELFESVGGFAPILLQFYGLNKVQAGVVGAAKVGRLFQFAKTGDKIVKTKSGTRIVKLGDPKNKASKADYDKYVKGKEVDNEEILSVKKFTSGDVLMHNARSAFLNMAVEEVKTQTVGFDTGSGVAFSGMNMLLGPFRFKTAFNQFNTFSNNVVKSGFTFAAAAEAAANFEAAVRHMEGTDDFQDWFKEHNPDGIFGSTARRRMFMNVILGNGLGLTHTTRNDWRSTQTLKKMREEAFLNYSQAIKEASKDYIGPKRTPEALQKAISENQAIYSEINKYIKRVELLEYHSSNGKMNEYISKNKEGIKKEFQDKFGKQLDIEVVENNNKKDFDSDTAKGAFDKKGNKFTIKINRQNNEIGVMPHELGHAAIDALFEGNVAIKQEYLASFNKILTGIKLKDGRTLLEAIKQEKSITRELTQEEMFTYTAEYLAKPEYRGQFIEQNAISELGQSIKGLFERNFEFIKAPKLRPGNIGDLVNFFGRYARSVNKGKGFTKYQDAFLQILEEAPGVKTKKKKDSKELSQDKVPAEYDIQRIKTNIELNKDYGNKIVGDRIRRELERELKRAEEVERLINEKSPEELRTSLELNKDVGIYAVRERNKKDLEYALITQQKRRFPGNVGVINPITGDIIQRQATTPGSVKFSEQLVKEAETNIERQILKQRTGKFEGNKILQDNIDLQYNKIAMAALGFKLKKSFDAQSLGLKRAEFNDALSFVTQYKDGIIKRWKPEITNPETGETQSIKFSTFVNANIKPKRALFYEQAFGKGAEVTGRITEKTKEIADTATKTERAPDLIDPLSFSKDATVIKKYEAGLKNIDLSKQDYSTLKDVAPKITDKIFGEAKTVIKDGKKVKISAHEVKQEFIKNNAKALYDLLPLAFRRMTEGTKSSTKINSGILKNFYVTGSRADMTVGTKAGLPIKAKIPWANASKKFNELFVEKKTGNDLRNQKTLVKGLQAEIGRAITNSVARRNPKHPDALVRKLADGKSEVLYSETLEKLNKIEKIPTINSQWKELYNIKGKEDIADIQKGIYKIGEKLGINAAPFFTSQTLAPGGKGSFDKITGKYKGTRDSTFFISGKNFDTQIKQAINDGKVIDLYGLKILAENVMKGQEAPSFTTAIKSQKTAGYNSKIAKGQKFYFEKKADHIKATKDILDIFAEMYKISPKAAGVIAYNVDASSSATRNMAMMRGKEFGAKKILEEHVLQHGQFSLLMGEYAKLKNGKNPNNVNLEAMAKYMAENYFQIALKSGEGKLKDRTDNHAKVDRPYIFDGQNVKLKSELHPVMAKQIKEALAGKREWSEVISPFIRMFNSQIAKGKGGSMNMNVIEFDGAPLPKYFDLVVPKRFEKIKAVYEKQAELAEQQMLDPGFKGKQELDLFIKQRYPKIKEGIKQVEKAIEKDAAKGTPKVKESINLDKTFNEYLEMSTGIAAEKIFSDAKAAARGRQVRKSIGDYFIPPGAEDFAGLLHKTLAKGKQGEKQLEFYQKALYDPYNLAMENIAREQVALSNDFRALTKQLSNVPKTLKKLTKGGDFTIEQAVRVAVWNKLGYEIPGLSKTDKNALIKEVKNNKELNLFASEIIRMTKGDGYAKPKESWIAGNIATDMIELLNGTKRTKHLEVWQNNVNELFSKKNLNKLEAAYGKNWVTNLNKTLVRMKSGSNRQFGGNATVEKWNDWINGSVGAIMFLNTRSAVLQTISNINYINFTDNNPLQAAKAFANQKQYWSDFVELYNSDYLKIRRGGNKINVNESELALAQKKGGAQGVIALLLNKGFVLTRGADSFAIATGGASMYRNRIKTYIKEGLSEAQAKEKAFLDFKKITEETQQSSRPDRISEQQASSMGRFMLAFANTPMQYNRIIKRNVQDLIDGRGPAKEKITRITYYGMIQNLIFNALQKALFISAFSTEDEEAEIKRNARIGEGMLDTLLRGTGLYGNTAVAIKNVAKAVSADKDVVQAALTISPPLYSKASKLRGADFQRKYITKDNIFEPSLDNPALGAGAQFSSAVFNFPLDRALRKANNIQAALSEDSEYWQKVALLLGWNDWELGLDKDDKKPKFNKQILDTRIQRQNTNTERLRIKRK